MKIIRRCLTLAAILIALPALADNQSQPSPLAADPDLLMLQTDLKVTLQHYEKLRAEAGEAELQLALGEAGTPDPAVEEARKALAETIEREKSKSGSKADSEEAARNYEMARKLADDNLTRRYRVLTQLADRARAEARELAMELAKRRKDSAFIEPQPAPPQP